MPRLIFCITLCTTLALLAGCKLAPQKAAAGADHSAQAQSFVQALVDGKYSVAAAGFDAVMAKAMSAQQLQQVWEGLLKQNGGFKSLGEVRSETQGAFEIVFVPCEFERASLDFKLVYDKNDKVGGLWIVPHVGKAEAEYSAPAYVQAASFTEKDVTVGSGEWKLPGTLALPIGAGPFPALVLVHGSGPNDRDETIGPNKPFKDLAQGLASQGIAVLRYDKRTKVYGAKLAASTTLTVKEETIDDALAAAALLRQTPGIDPKKVFVLGHSLGGMLIPRIGLADPGIQGLIVMSGPSRPMEDLMLEQMVYLASLTAPTADSQKQLDAVRAQIATIKSPKLSPATPAAQALGAPGSYWLDLRGYAPAEAAKELEQPLLILQGGRDYQVTADDLAGWQKALSGQPNVSFKLYPNLNHLYMEGQGKSTPQEYGKRGPVAKEAVDDIAKWIKEH